VVKSLGLRKDRWFEAELCGGFVLGEREENSLGFLRKRLFAVEIYFRTKKRAISLHSQ
jgi:hypothetical protein